MTSSSVMEAQLLSTYSLNLKENTDILKTQFKPPAPAKEAFGSQNARRRKVANTLLMCKQTKAVPSISLKVNRHTNDSVKPQRQYKIQREISS